jgi:prephenate dehydratase
VRRVKEEGNLGDVAIAAREAADLFELSILKEAIETNARNYTRFVVIAADKVNNGSSKKSSLVYATSNKPGALFDTLKIFAENGLNLVKLESRPIHGKPWEYMFYVDLEADVESDELSGVMDQLSEHTEFLKILGCY